MQRVWVRGEAYTGFWWGNLRERDQLRPSRKWDDNIKLDLQEVDRVGSGQGQVAGTCECGNEPQGSMKCGEFLDQLKIGQLLKKDSSPWIK